LVFVDSAQKEDALAILDKRFLSDVAHQSDAYRKWFDKYAVFSYGSTEKTESFDVSRGLAVRGGSRLFRMAESIAKIPAIPLGSES